MAKKKRAAARRPTKKSGKSKHSTGAKKKAASKVMSAPQKIVETILTPYNPRSGGYGNIAQWSPTEAVFKPVKASRPSRVADAMRHGSVALFNAAFPGGVNKKQAGALLIGAALSVIAAGALAEHEFGRT